MCETSYDGPLVISDEDLDRTLEVLDHALTQAASS